MLDRFDTDLTRNPEFQSALVRLSIWLFAVFYIGIAAWSGYYRIDYTYYTVLFGSFLVLFLGLLGSVLWRPEWPWRRFLSLLLDISATSLCIYMTQDVVSPFYLIYIWIFISYGTRYGKRHLIAASLLSICAYLVVLISLGQWQQYTFEVVFFLLLLILLPLYQYVLLRKLHHARQEAEQSARAKSVFLSCMTHELRTPLSGIVGLSGLLMNSPLNPQQREHVESITTSASMLDVLIREVLDLSSIEAGGIELKPQPFDLKSLCRDVLMTLSHQTLERRLELICRLDPSLPSRLCYDELRLRQILFNLLTNALKFTDRGEVELLIRRESADPPAHLEIEVRDSGIGLDEQEQERLFERFWQADMATGERQGGIGLGTTITQQLIRLMNGEIRVQSRKGVGTSVCVRLPLTDTVQEMPPNPSSISGKDAILVYDTNSRVCGHIRQACAEQRISCVTLSRVMDLETVARQAAEKAPIRLAIIGDSPCGLDLQGVGERIRGQLGGQLPLIYLGYMQRRVMNNQEACYFQPKPLFTTDLICQIRQVLGYLNPTDCPELLDSPGMPDLTDSVKVLVAEDNVINGQVLQTMLQNLGCEVVWVKDGAEAQQVASAEDFDIAFIDLRMPHKSGLDFVREYREQDSNKPRLPIIALTANSGITIQQQCLQAGMDDFLTKPVDATQLQLMINRHLFHTLEQMA